MNAGDQNPRTADAGTPQKRFYGKYRGVVTDNVDPMMLGRVLAAVPSLPGALLNWAMPCVPYAGPEVGSFALPPIGANVWIEFEGGNPNFPIWSGGFWEEGEFPYAEALDPVDPQLVKVFKTLFGTIIVNDTAEEGGVIMEVNDPAVDVPITMLWSSLGVEINTGISNVLMTPEEGITLSVGEVVIAMTEEGITLTGPVISVEAEADVNVNAGEGVQINAGADLEIAAGGAAELNAGGDLELAAGGAAELNAGGDLEMAAGGAAELNAGGDLEMAAVGAAELNAGLDLEMAAGLACELNAGLDLEIAAGAAIQVSAVGDIALTSVSQMLTGLVEVNGDLLIDGQQPLVI